MKSKIHLSLRPISLGFFCITALVSALSAADGPARQEVVNLEKFTVNSVPLEKQILPTARPFTSVFGTEDDIMSIPRNVNIVSREQMDAINIQDVTEFSKLTSSSYTDSNFGSPSNPTIRGQSSDVFMNGMRQRIGENGGGMPVDFNQVESVNIVSGPATAVQGASAYIGGFVDLITKQPFFDHAHGSASVTYGSDDTKRFTVDVGGPISSKLAYRLSYSGEDSQGYWYDWLKQTTSVYGALSWRPSETYDLFFVARGFSADYRENFGINRPTQALISDGLYIPGTNINNNTSASPANLQNALNVQGSNVIAFGTPVPVDYRQTAQGPASHAHGNEFNVQAIQSFKLQPDFKIINNTIWSFTKRDTFNSDGFNEIVDPAWFLDNRTEFIFKIAGNTVNAGLEEKYQHVLAYDDFFFEPVNVWDLSNRALRSDINFALSNYFGGFVHQPVPGWPGRYATQGIINNDTSDSEEYNVSPYIQGTWKASDRVSIVSGGRLDFMHVKVKDPLTPNTSAQTSVVEPNANLSGVYKVSPTVSTYLTYNYSQNYSGDLADAGGFGIYSDSNTGLATIPKTLLKEASNLYEAGTKLSLLENKLFVSSDVFYQTRQNKPQGQPVIHYEYYGFELSGNYQPNKYFYATLGYSWINGSLPAPVPFQGYATQQIPGGPPNPFTNPAAHQTTGRLRAPGQPLNTVNALISYTLDSGIGFTVNGLLTSKMNNDYQGYLVIPVQHEIDGSIFYKRKQWEFRFKVNNLTNQHNWTPQNPTYGLEGVVANPALQMFGTIKYNF